MTDSRRLENAPPPVSRYLRRALQDHQLLIERAQLRQSGRLRAGIGGRWLPFTAQHQVVPARAEFRWDARVKMLPLVHLDIRDSYNEGQGSSEARLFSVLTIARRQGGDPVNSGSLHRYLAEAVWYPTALLPSDQLRWSPIDETRALATLTHGGTTVSLEFWFQPDGEVAGIYTPGRWGAFPGGYKQAPWEGHFSDYGRRGGLLVPIKGEVGWYLDGRWTCVWQGQLEQVHFAFGA